VRDECKRCTNILVTW